MSVPTRWRLASATLVMRRGRARAARTRDGDLVDGLLVKAMWVTLAVYAVALITHGPAYEASVDGWLGVATMLLPATACWSAWRYAGHRRSEVTCICIGMSAFVAGNVSYVISASGGGSVPFPSPADAGFLTFYPLALAALVLAIRRELRGARRSIWYDGVLGALGALTVLVTFLGPPVANHGDSTLAIAVAVAYPAFDLMLMTTVVGLVALQGFRIRPHWWPFVAGLSLFAITDTIFAFRVTDNTYVVGTPLDALWPLAMTLVAVWVRTPHQSPAARVPGPASLAVPALSTGAAVLVLLWATRHDVSTVAELLATLTLVAIAGRMYLAFSQLWQMADLRHQANTDELTGLPNRRAFGAAVTTDLARHPMAQALLLLDLDGFKEINDTLGHRAGDQMLIEVGWRLQQSLAGSGFLARLGGDEFAVLIDEADHDDAIAAAARLQLSLVDPINLAGTDIRVGASIGIALHPEHGQDLDHLLSAADSAMYRAKALHEDFRVYVPSDGTLGQTHFQTVADLRLGLRDRQFTLHYQAKVDVRTYELRGVEALVRWEHPTRGLLQPSCFLPHAQHSGLMSPLTSQVLAQALDQAATWHRQKRRLTVAVNLTANALDDVDLPARVGEMLSARDLPPEALQLEITEESVMSDRRRCGGILAGLRDLGVQIAIDDFGTGYSSLAYLRDLPIDELKLDRSFITSMVEEPRAAALVSSTIALAHSLELRMVAEGVETQAALNLLARLGCDQAQGHLIAKPLPVQQLEQWIARHEAAHRLGRHTLEALG